MELQTISLLATIIAILSNLLSLSEKLSKIGTLGIIKILSYFALPILFFQQILQVTVSAGITFKLIIMFSSLVLFLICLYLKRKDSLIADEFFISILLVISAIAFFYKKHILLLSSNLNGNIHSLMSNLDIDAFMNSLGKYKICLEMYTFLGTHLLEVFFIMLDSVSIVLFVIVIIQFSKWLIHFYSQNTTISFETPNICNVAKYSIVLLCLCSGLGNIFVAYISSLF